MSKKTCCVTIGKITSLGGEIAQNNVLKYLFLDKVVADKDSGRDEIMQEYDITVAETDTPVVLGFLIKKPINGVLAFFTQTWFFPLGKGIYNPIGAHVTASELQKIEEKPLTDTEANEIISNGVVFDLGQIDIKLEDYINNSEPPFDLMEPDTKYYFQFSTNGNDYIYFFDGIPGIYGLGQDQVSTLNFILVYTSDAVMYNQNDVPVLLNLNMYDLQDYVFEYEQINESIINAYKTSLEKEKTYIIKITNWYPVENLYMGLEGGFGHFFSASGTGSIFLPVGLGWEKMQFSNVPTSDTGYALEFADQIEVFTYTPEGMAYITDFGFSGDLAFSLQATTTDMMNQLANRPPVIIDLKNVVVDELFWMDYVAYQLPLINGGQIIKNIRLQIPSDIDYMIFQDLVTAGWLVEQQ